MLPRGFAQLAAALPQVRQIEKECLLQNRDGAGLGKGLVSFVLHSEAPYVGRVDGRVSPDGAIPGLAAVSGPKYFLAIAVNYYESKAV